ncbi:MAG: tetratricopeptide repeat protein [Muribaculaceae bacterium]|nr:tetratricopeptide repeat protein [Muribaculaceae bacterium]
MKSRKLLFASLLFAMSMTALAEDFNGILINTKQNKWASSNYFAKGVNAINDDDLEDAIDMFGKEVKQHPSNGYAVCNLAQCQFTAAKNEMYTNIYSDDRSEEEINIAIEKGFKGMRAALPLFDKGLSLLPTTDGEALCQAYRVKASMLRNFEDLDSLQVVECYNKAIAVHPCEDVYNEHMDFCFSNTEVVIADAQALRKLCPDDPSNVKVLAVMAYRNKDYAQCLALCEEYNAMLKAQDEDALDIQIASLKIISLKELDRDSEAMDLALTCITDYDFSDAIQMFLDLAEKNPDLAEIKIKQRMFAENGEEVIWNFMLGRIMKLKKDYKGALEYFKKVEKTERVAMVYNEISNCYYMLGDTDNALKYIEAATVMEGGSDYLTERDVMLVNLGMASKVISEKMTGVEIVKNIDETEFFQRFILAELLLQEHDYAQAATILEPMLDKDDGASALSLYATALKGLGRDDEAQRSLLQITEIDPLPDDDLPYRAVALYELGRGDEAIEMANSLAQEWENHQLNRADEKTPESCYTITTVFAQIGDSDKALEYLEKHFLHDSMPYNFGFMDRDWRLDSVRELPQYKTLVEKYKTIWKSNATPTNK